MNMRDRLKHSLTHSRGFADRIFDEISAPEQWTQQPCENTNHALWIAGHLAIADNYFIGLVDESKRIDLSDYEKPFGKGSEPIADLSAYPDPESVIERMAERRQTFLEVLDSCSEEDLAQETPDNAPGFMPDHGTVFSLAVWHEALHVGQLTVVHRMLGNSPLADRQKAAN